MPISRIIRTLLIIDDDATFTKVAKTVLTDDTTEVMTASTGAEGLGLCRKIKIDVILLDQKLPDGEGAALCPKIMCTNDQAKIIFITAFPSFENALKAIENGAFTYLAKPIEPKELKLAVQKCFRILDLEKTEEGLRYQERRESEQAILVGHSASIARIEQLVTLASDSDANVLITGETGSGKSLIAKLIHLRGGKTGSFLSINCAALPENLIEAELFGYEKGSFSGAVASKKGLLEIAEAGTLLLDEIGEMSSHLQAKLLGVLDDKRIRRIGGTVERNVTTRIIAATNSQIEKRLKTNEFREDLYYRLNVIRIHIPPLRERTEDIVDLVGHFLATFSRNQRLTLPSREMNALTAYAWPGNVRELKNVLERAILLHPQGDLKPSQLLETADHAPMASSPLFASEEILTLQEIERQTIRSTLEKLNGNYTHTAKALGISLSTLKRKIKEFGLA